jgi:hypothetical protein
MLVLQAPVRYAAWSYLITLSVRWWDLRPRTGGVRLVGYVWVFLGLFEVACVYIWLR